MANLSVLHESLSVSARRRPDHPAVAMTDGAHITYRALDRLSDRVRDRLWHLGVRPGDRVGMCCPKSIDAIAVIFGILKTGAAYVPCDPHAPAERNAYILSNCEVRLALVEDSLAKRLRPELERQGRVPPLFSVPGAGDG